MFVTRDAPGQRDICDKCPGPGQASVTSGRGHRGVGIPFLNVDSQADQTSALGQNRRGGGSADVKNEWRWKQNEGKNIDPRIAMIMGHLSWRNFQFQLFEKVSHV